MRVTKHQRQHRIAKLLESQSVGSQGQLVELLAADGIDATQTTVSRDLEELGALKIRVAGGETAYALPELPTQQFAPADHLRRVLGEWVVEVASSHNLVVLRTPPGCAHVVGSALDRSGLDGVVGTVAGDDTVLVVVAEGWRGRDMADHLEALAAATATGAATPAATATAAVTPAVTARAAVAPALSPAAPVAGLTPTKPTKQRRAVPARSPKEQ